MPYWEEHGGGCCGAFHIRDFQRGTEKKSIENEIADARGTIFEEDAPVTDSGDRVHGGNYLCECILTNQQLRVHRESLKEIGFKRVAVWRNPNTGNVLNMLVLYDKVNRHEPY